MSCVDDIVTLRSPKGVKTVCDVCVVHDSMLNRNIWYCGVLHGETRGSRRDEESTWMAAAAVAAATSTTNRTVQAWPPTRSSIQQGGTMQNTFSYIYVVRSGSAFIEIVGE